SPRRRRHDPPEGRRAPQFRCDAGPGSLFVQRWGLPSDPHGMDIDRPGPRGYHTGSAEALLDWGADSQTGTFDRLIDRRGNEEPGRVSGPLVKIPGARCLPTGLEGQPATCRTDWHRRGKTPFRGAKPTCRYRSCRGTPLSEWATNRPQADGLSSLALAIQAEGRSG